MKLRYDDNTHSYWLNNKRCKSVTTVAKIPDDTWSLDQWRKRQIVVGMATSPQLVERAAAHHDDREHLDRIAEEALVAAKAHEAAGRGTAAHRITERVDTGAPIIDTDMARLVAAQWRDILDRYQLEVVPELIERIVVWPEQRIAGRFDRVCRRPDGSLVVVDLKTGGSAVRYPHSMAIQLALYAHAPLLAGELVNGETETFVALPDNLDRDIGLIVHMPGGEQQPAVYTVDIAAGMRTAETMCFPTLEWRARRDLIAPLPTQPVSTSTSDTNSEPNDSGGTADSGDSDRIRERLNSLAKSETARKLVAAQWPPGAPPKGPWTEQQVGELDKLLWAVERVVGAPFPSDTGQPVHTPNTVPEPPAPSAPPVVEHDNGPVVDQETIDALAKQIQQLPERKRRRAHKWVTEGRDNGHPWALGATGNHLRQWSITRAAARCLTDMWDDDNPETLTRVALQIVTGHLEPSWKTGAVFGSLTTEQADRLTDLVDGWTGGEKQAVHAIVEGTAAYIQQTNDKENTSSD